MKLMRSVFALLTPSERRRGTVLLGLMLVGMVLETVGIGVIIPGIALLTERDVTARHPALARLLTVVGHPTQAQLMGGAMVALVLVYLVKALYLAFLAWHQNRFGYDVQANLSQRLFTIYLRQPYTFHLERNSAQLIRNAINEVNQFTFNVFLPLLLLLTEGMVLLGIGVLLLMVEPLGTVLVALVLGVAGGAFHLLTEKRVARWGVARQFHEGLRLQHLQQGLGGAKDVKLLGRESDFLALYAEHNRRSSLMTQYQVTLQQFPRLWLEFLAVLALATLVLTMLEQGRDLASIVPSLGLFAAAAFRMMPSVNRVLQSVGALRYGHPVIALLQGELSLPVPGQDVSEEPTVPFAREIALEDVSFSYSTGHRPAIDRISLVVRHGETVGVVGTSGAGKSTLVDLVLGLLTPTAGRVVVDGRDIQRSLRAWQSQIGYVTQSVYLTDDTLRRNVAFGLPDNHIDDAAVRRALRAAQLEDFIASLPEGTQSIVGERGVRLSGGQRQRIGIARALYHDPSVLVLDEATSALDTVTEHEVMQAVAALHGRTTILIIAHRLSTVSGCDRLYRLEDGRVALEGHPSELLDLVHAV